MNFTQSGKQLIKKGDICIMMEATFFLFVNAAKMYQLKAKYSEINPYLLCLGNISKNITIDKDEKEL